MDDKKDIKIKTPASMEIEITTDVLPLGPRPGVAICSFWQGRVEMSLRFMLILVVCLPAALAAALALAMHRFGDLNENVPTTGPNQFLPSIFGAFVGTFIFASCAVFVAGLAIIKELVMIILRFCNCGCANRGIMIILIIDIIFSYIFSLCHLAVGVLTALGAGAWGIAYNPLIAGEKATLSLCAVFCFIAASLYAAQASWTIGFLANKWNKKVEKYTLDHLYI